MAKTIRAHMPGVVEQILVAPGHAFAKGEAVALLESMKMQIPIEASEAGVVETLEQNPGDVVDEGAVILTYR